MQTTATLQKLIGEWDNVIRDPAIQDVLNVADPEGLQRRLWDLLGCRLLKMQGLGPEDSEPGKSKESKESKPVVEVPKRVPEPETSEPPADQVNSSTHRREHARLSRRMQSLSEPEFPHMHRLWAGNRQDGLFQVVGFRKKTYMFRARLIHVFTTCSRCNPTH